MALGGLKGGQVWPFQFLTNGCQDRQFQFQYTASPAAPGTPHFFIPSLLACQAAVNKSCVDRVKVEFWPLTPNFYFSMVFAV